MHPFAQVLRETRQVAFRQRLELSHHLPSLLYGVEALHPKHDSHLDLQGQYSAKRLVSGVDQPATVHLNTVKSMRLTSVLDLPLLILSYPPITDSR